MSGDPHMVILHNGRRERADERLLPPGGQPTAIWRGGRVSARENRTQDGNGTDCARQRASVRQRAVAPAEAGIRRRMPADARCRSVRLGVRTYWESRVHTAHFLPPDAELTLNLCQSHSILLTPSCFSVMTQRVSRLAPNGSTSLIVEVGMFFDSCIDGADDVPDPLYAMTHVSISGGRR